MFLFLLDKQAPIKRKKVRGNHAQIINKKLSKTVMVKFDA